MFLGSTRSKQYVNCGSCFKGNWVVDLLMKNQKKRTKCTYDAKEIQGAQASSCRGGFAHRAHSLFFVCVSSLGAARFGGFPLH